MVLFKKIENAWRYLCGQSTAIVETKTVTKEKIVYVDKQTPQRQNGTDLKEVPELKGILT